MRSRAQMLELPNNSGGDLGINDDNLNKRHLREYLHVPGKSFFLSAYLGFFSSLCIERQCLM